MTLTSVNNPGQPLVVSATDPWLQPEAPFAQLLKDLLELIATSLTANGLVSLGSSCRLFQHIFNASSQWISLFQQTFPHHSLKLEPSPLEQYKQQHLPQRKLIQGNWDQFKCQTITYDKLAVRYNALAFFQNFVLANGENNTIAAYKRNTMEKLYEFTHDEHLCNWYDGGDVFISSNIDKSNEYIARVWEKNTGKHVCWIENCKDLIADKDLIFGTQTRRGAGLENYTQLVAWNKNTGEVKFTFEPSKYSLNHMLHQDRFFAIVNGKVFAWQTTDGSLIGTFEDGSQVESFVVTDHVMVSSHKNNELRIWSKNNYQCTYILKAKTSYHTLTLHGTLLGGVGSSLIEVWNIEDRLSLVSRSKSLYFFDRDKIYFALQEKGKVIIEAGLVQHEFQFPTHILTYSTDQIDQILVSEGRLFALTRQKCLHVWDMVSKKRLLSLTKIFQFHVEDDCIFVATTTDDSDRILKVLDFRHQQLESVEQ